MLRRILLVRVEVRSSVRTVPGARGGWDTVLGLGTPSLWGIHLGYHK